MKQFLLATASWVIISVLITGLFYIANGQSLIFKGYISFIYALLVIIVGIIIYIKTLIEP